MGMAGKTGEEGRAGEKVRYLVIVWLHWNLIEDVEDWAMLLQRSSNRKGIYCPWNRSD